MGEIRSLTGLRFIAAFSVLSGHMAMTEGGAKAFDAPWPTLPGMTLFFCLSGFVLTWTYPQVVKAGRFLWARFARIYPLFAAVFVVEAIVNGIEAPQVASHALLLHAWGVEPGFFAVSWSLSVELFFYVTFPLLALVLVRLSRRQLVWTAVLSVFASLVMALIAAYWFYGSETWPTIFPPARFPAFLFGCVMARLALDGVRLPAWSAAALLAGTVLLHQNVTIFEPEFREDVLFMAPLGLLILALATSDSRTARALGHPLMLKLGVASYALYLSHPLVRQLSWEVFGPVPTLAVTLVAIIAAVAASWTLYRLIEQPARTWLRSLRLPRVRVARPVPESR